MEFVAALERQFSFQILQIATNTRDSREFAGRSENHGSVFGFQIAGNIRASFAAAVADVADVQIEMVTPEKRRHNEGLTRANNVARSGLALPLRDDPVLHPHAPRARIGPARDVASGKYSRHICLQKFGYIYAVVRPVASCIDQRVDW